MRGSVVETAPHDEDMKMDEPGLLLTKSLPAITACLAKAGWEAR